MSTPYRDASGAGGWLHGPAAGVSATQLAAHISGRAGGLVGGANDGIPHSAHGPGHRARDLTGDLAGLAADLFGGAGHGIADPAEVRQLGHVNAKGLASDRSAATLTLFLVAAWALALIARPYTWWRTALITTMLAAYALTAAIPATAAFFALTYTDPVTDAITIASATAGILVLTVLHVFQPRPTSLDDGPCRAATQTRPDAPGAPQPGPPTGAGQAQTS